MSTYSLTTLVNFSGGNGALPDAGVIADSAGNLYGTTEVGGASNAGTVFEFVKSTGVLQTLVTFTDAGSEPDALIADSAGNFFGTTGGGGASNEGTVFEIVKSTGVLQTLGTFTGANGVFPQPGLIADSAGNLYGTTLGDASSADGTVFELVKSTGVLQTLGTFTGANGEAPFAGVIADNAGNLYGTTELGGALNKGTVFEIVKSTGVLQTLGSFTGADGAFPISSLIADSAGNLYGTTEEGGVSNDGTVFELVRSTGVLQTLASFSGGNGNGPLAGLIADSVGNLYGTTFGGGASNRGTVFEFVKSTGTLQTLVSFSGANGGAPSGDLLADSAGNLYGTAFDGGASNEGTVFELTPDPGTAPAVAPVIGGTTAQQSTTAEQPIDPFATVTVSDANANASDTLTITVGGSGGVLSGSGLASNGNGVYTLTGSAAAVTSALQALSFTSAAGAPNTSSTATLSMSDLSSASSTPATALIAVTDTDPAVAPAIGGTTAQQSTTSEQPIAPFAAVTVTDSNANATDTLSITVSGSGGALSGSGLTSNGNGVYTLTGTAAAVTSALEALSFTPAAGASNTSSTATLALSDVSSASPTPATASVSVTDTDPAVAPAIGGTTAQQSTTAEQPIDPFATVTVTDSNANATDTLTITVSGSGGALSGSGLASAGNGVYTLTGTAAAVTSALEALSFTPAAGAPNTSATATLALSDVSSADPNAVATGATSVIDADPVLDNASLFGSTTQDVTSPGGQIYALYQTILGRAPDPIGFEQSVAALDGGTPLTTIAEGFLSSAEYTAHGGPVAQRSDDAFITQLYQDGLHRAPEPAGLQSWEQALGQGGVSRAQVAVDFAISPESQNDLAPVFAAGVFVPDAADAALARLYDGLLGRAPDAGGLQHYEQLVHGGSLTLPQVAQEFLSSPEYETTAVGQSNAQFITGLYQTALGRTPGTAGRQHYELALDTVSMTRADVVADFLSSTEFKADTAADDDATYINKVYTVALGRQAEPGGLQFWEHALATGTSRSMFDQDAVSSAEFKAQVTDPSQALFVNTLYQGALGRTAGHAGLQHYEDILSSLASPGGFPSANSVALGITQSPEAQAHLAPRIELGFQLV